MPANDHLQWSEIREFGGLWTRGDNILAPANSATVMSGCHPQPGGGLRPFFKVEDSRPSTGINSLALPRAFYPAFGLNQANHEFVVVTAKNGGVDWTSYGWYAPDDTWEETGEEDGSATAFAGTDSATFADARMPFFTTYQSGSTPGTRSRKLYMTLPIDTAGENLYEFSTIAGGPEMGFPAWEPHPDWTPPEEGLGPLCMHQNRLVVCQDGVILFSEPGDTNVLDTDEDTRFIIPDSTGKGDDRIAWMVPIPPSDLMVCTVSGNLYNIQGDLDDPTIRELGRWGPSVYQGATLTPRGVACIYPNDGVYLVTPDGGREFISGALSGDNFTQAFMAQDSNDNLGFGSIAYSNGYLFVPNNYSPLSSPMHNGALVYDMNTGAWFTSTHFDSTLLPNPKHFHADYQGPNPGVWGMTKNLPSGSNPLLARIVPGDTSATARSQRNNKWVWQSQVLRNRDSRQIELREVHLTLNSGGDAEVTVQVFSDIEDQSVTINPASGQTFNRLQFRVRGDFVIIAVTASEGIAGREAPTLESIRWGTRPGHLR